LCNSLPVVSWQPIRCDSHTALLVCTIHLVLHASNTASLQGTSATITDCVLQSNNAVASGGALFVAGRSGSVSQTSIAVTLLSNSLLIRNTALSGGAVACDVDAGVVLTSCSIENNTAVTEVSVTLLHVTTEHNRTQSEMNCTDVLYAMLS
jgi:hypothetical protein